MKIDLGIIIGVLGIIVGLGGSFFFYRKNKKVKKLIYRAETTVLISEDLSSYENLKILYNNENIDTLNSTTIKIRNIGNDIIEPKDFVPSMPIIIKTSDHFLLQDFSKYKITCSDSKNRVNLEKIDESNFQVVFDYLNPKDEITIAILHTGDITITGDLKQKNSVKNYSNKKYGKEESDYIDNTQTDIIKIYQEIPTLAAILVMALLFLYFLLRFMSGYNVYDPSDTLLTLLMLMFQMVTIMILLIRKK